MGKAETTRETILDAALATASQVGLAGLSLGDLARRVGMSKSGLFAHFESKEDLQLEVLRQTGRPKLVALDTMNYWITGKREALRRVLAEVDAVVVNDAEARMLTEEANLARAARRLMEMGPDVIVAKRGEYGAALFVGDELFAIPGFLLEDVRDPTGAGDSFAGGMMGYLAEQGKFDPVTLKTAMAYGVLVASFNVEDFSLDRLRGLNRADLERRMTDYRRMLSF